QSVVDVRIGGSSDVAAAEIPEDPVRDGSRRGGRRFAPARIDGAECRQRASGGVATFGLGYGPGLRAAGRHSRGGLSRGRARAWRGKAGRRRSPARLGKLVAQLGLPTLGRLGLAELEQLAQLE